MNPAAGDERDEEIARLRSAMRGLVELSSLPTWSPGEAEGVAADQAALLCRALSLDFAYLVLETPAGGRFDVLGCRDAEATPELLQRVRDALAPNLEDEREPPAELPDPIGEGTIRVCVSRFGTGPDAGVLVAAAKRAGFPTEEARLLIGIAANQIAIGRRSQQGSESRAALAAIVESTDDAVVGKNLDGIITSWNRGAEQLFGYSAEETQGRSITMLIPPERLHEEKIILERLRRGERIDHYETVRVRKDGQAIDVSLTVSPIRADSGRIVGASKIARDITARKQAEREALELLAREREALREAQLMSELARTLGGELDVVRLAQAITDTATALTSARYGAFFYVAPDAEGQSSMHHALSGAPREAFEKLGMPWSMPLFGPTLHGEGPIRIDDVLEDSRHGPLRPDNGTSAGQLPVRSYLAVPVVSRSGTVHGGLFFGHPDPGMFTERAERLVLGVAAQAGICLDNAQLYRAAQQEIVERRSAEQRERVARTEAERATRVRDEFLATVSHELRTPLNSILGWTQLLQKARNDPEIERQALTAIERGTRAQARLVEDLLDVSRIISGKLRLEVQSVELVTTVHAAIDTIRPAAEAKNIRIEHVVDPLAGPIRGDPARLQQVVWNLLSNAVKFTPSGGRAHVLVERIDSHVEISVSDDGRGISPELLPYVFDRFWQADATTTRTHGGMGLGLAVVKHLVELHGGRVFARSSGEGKGATFTVHLPIGVVRQEPEGHEFPSAPRRAGDPESEARLTDVRVLVVDDDSDACEILRRVLQERGACVETAPSGRDALQRFDKLRPNIVLSDIGMPEMDGYELIREIRRRGSNVAAVAITAFGRSEDRVRSLRAGYHMHLAKPLEPRELVEVVASLVKRDPAKG